MIPLSYLSALEFSGQDVREFLQSQLSADLAAIPVGKAGFACYCNPQGRVLGELLVGFRENGCFAICSAELAEGLKQRLGMFVLRSDVQLQMRQDLVVCGNLKASAAGDGVVLTDHISGTAYTLAATGVVNGAEHSEAAWKAVELDAGIAWLHADTSAQFLPQMLAAERIGALSFKKGCYPGQEIVARTRYLGKLKRRLLWCRVHGLPVLPRLTEVSLAGDSEEAVAVVLDQVTPEGGETHALLVARTEKPFEVQFMEVQGCRLRGQFQFLGRD